METGASDHARMQFCDALLHLSVFPDFVKAAASAGCLATVSSFTASPTPDVRTFSAIVAQRFTEVCLPPPRKPHPAR